MSKYQPLWESVGADGRESFTLSFDEIAAVLGFPIDHAFLSFKKELRAHGYEVGKISLKGKTVAFRRIDPA